MNEVQNLVKAALGKSGSKKTKNMELCYKIIQALATDDEYVATYIKKVDSVGQIVTEECKLAGKFKKLIADALQQCTSLSKEEAKEAAKKFRMSQEHAKSILEIASEGMRITIDECGKKVQLFNTPDNCTTLELTNVGETVRNNPRDDNQVIVIAPRKKVKASRKTMSYEKSIRNK